MLQTCFRTFCCQFLRSVKIRSGEVSGVAGRVAVLAILKICSCQGGEDRIFEMATKKPIHHRCEPRYRRRDDNASRPAHAPRLAERLEPIGTAGKMIERTQEEHSIHTCVRVGKLARVAYSGFER